MTCSFKRWRTKKWQLFQFRTVDSCRFEVIEPKNDCPRILIAVRSSVSFVQSDRRRRAASSDDTKELSRKSAPNPRASFERKRWPKWMLNAVFISLFAGHAWAHCKRFTCSCRTGGQGGLCPGGAPF